MNPIYQERARAISINELGRLHQRQDLASLAIYQGWSFERFKSELIKEISPPERRPLTEVGLSKKEIELYSISRALYQISSDPVGLKAGLEREASDAVAKALNSAATQRGFFVPYEVQGRDLTVATAGAGGYLVATEHPEGSFIQALYKRMIIRSLGATILSGLRGNATMPRQSGVGVGYWLSTESTSITQADQTFGELGLTPKTVGAFTKISRQLLLQSSPSIETVLLSDLGSVLRVAIETAALSGSGASGQPLGIIGTSGIGEVTGTSLAWDDILEFQSDLLAANALINAGTCGYVTTTAVAALLSNRQGFGSTDRMWKGNLLDGTLADFQAKSTEQIPAGNMIFGDWSQLVIGEWGVLEIASDPFSGNNFREAKISVRAFYTVDVGVRNKLSFSLATGIT